MNDLYRKVYIVFGEAGDVGFADYNEVYIVAVFGKHERALAAMEKLNEQDTSGTRFWIEEFGVLP